MLSTIDFAPTLLEAAGLPALDGIDGRSFLEIAKGGRQSGRDHIVTMYHETFAKHLFEMRAIRTRDAAYIWNAWSDGKTQYRAENMSGASWAAMVRAGESDPEIRDRCEYYLYRTPEEFFVIGEDDGDERSNRIADPDVSQQMIGMRSRLLEWMDAYDDPLAAEFRKIATPP